MEGSGGKGRHGRGKGRETLYKSLKNLKGCVKRALALKVPYKAIKSFVRSLRAL